jgi:ubiquitin carboxyl-terminal hydrolase 25/28
VFVAAHELLICSRIIFDQLGFKVMTIEGPTPEEFLIPPNTELGSLEGQEARMKLLRVWVEISAYLADYQRRFGKR